MTAYLRTTFATVSLIAVLSFSGFDPTFENFNDAAKIEIVQTPPPVRRRQVRRRTRRRTRRKVERRMENEQFRVVNPVPSESWYWWT